MYYFYMGDVLLPVTPEKFSVKIKNKNSTVTLINDGEVNIIKEAGLTDLEFDVLIPSVRYSFAKYDDGFKSPAYFTNHFETLKSSKKPFQFIVVRKMPDEKLLFDTNMTVALESYTITESANNGFDLTVSIKLKQHRPYGTKIIKIVEPEDDGGSGEGDQPVIEPEREDGDSPEPDENSETTYTVKSGDTLSKIAKQFYGDSSKWPAIYNANKDKIQNPNIIRVGQVLVIPALENADLTPYGGSGSRRRTTLEKPNSGYDRM